MTAPAGWARFAELLAREPGAPAVECGGRVVRRGEVDAASGSAALRAVDAGLRVGEPALLLLSLDADGIVGYTAGLRSVGAVVVLDAALPDEHVAGIVARTGARVAIVTPAFEARARALGLTPVVAAVGREDVPPAGAGAAAITTEGVGGEPGPDDLSRIVFTSGSTGRPKGVARHHRNDEWGRQPPLGAPIPADPVRLAQLVPFGPSQARRAVFDMVNDGTVVLPYDARAEGIPGIPAFLEAHRATAIVLTVGQFRALAAVARRPLPSCTVAVSLTGEAVDVGDVHAFRRLFGPAATLTVSYGLTEGGGVGTWALEPGAPVPDGPIRYGPGRRATDVRIAGPDGSPVPDGEVGEIVLRGRNVASGYWDDPELTAARFFTDPDGTRGYRSGDLGRRSGGAIEVLGRADDQVSVRGTNVHLGNVEVALRALPGVRDAAATAVPAARGGVRLVAALVTDEPPPTATAVRDALAGSLPAAMVPSVFLRLDALPRGRNGKADRGAVGALAADETTPRLPLGRPFRAPAPGAEAHIAAEFASVLGVAPVGGDDDFFALGGDSLAAEELVARLQDIGGTAVTRGAVLECPTPAALALRVGDGARPTDGLVLLHRGGTGEPLFVAPGGGQEPFDLLRLAHRLGADRPVYSFRSLLYDRRGLPDRSVPAAAARYLAAFERRVGRPPALLAGYSAGAAVALEMANQLGAAGRPPRLLVTIDGSAPLVEPQRSRPWRTGASLRELRAELGGPGGLGALPMAHRPLAAAKALTRRPRAWFAHHTLGLVRRDRVTQFNLLYQASSIAVARYRAQQWTGRALVVVADDSENTRRDLSHWSRWLTGEVTVTKVPGDHHSLLREPHVAPLAAAIAGAARETDPPETSSGAA